MAHPAVASGGPISTLPLPFQVLIALAPCVAVIWAVFKQSKTIAALAQLSDLQERDDSRRSLANRAIKVDKTWFSLGVTNIWATSYILGGWPCAYFLFYTPKVLLLILLRFVSFKKKKQHFLLMDFCYWANFLCIFYCWVMPTSPWLFRVVFMCSNGPLAWSVLAFNHAMIFHSFAHITSVVVHTSPLILTYALRWNAAPVGHTPGAGHFAVCDGGTAQGCQDVGFFQIIGDALVGFYLWWMILYYIFVFFTLGSYLDRNGYQTLWDRILQMKPVGPLLQGLLKKFPKLVVQLVYLLIHLGFSTATMCVACVLWWSQVAHFAFMFAVVLSTVRNAASFYFEVFEKQYEEVVDAGGKGREAMSKKVLAASPALAELTQPLGC